MILVRTRAPHAAPGTATPVGYAPRPVDSGRYSSLDTAPDIEAWAERYVQSIDLSHKLAPAPPPKAFRGLATAQRLLAPGRPPELRPAKRTERTPKPQALDE